jgi:hypothetical protein
MLLGELRQPDHQQCCQPEVVQVVGDLGGNSNIAASSSAVTGLIETVAPLRRSTSRV